MRVVRRSDAPPDAVVIVFDAAAIAATAVDGVAHALAVVADVARECEAATRPPRLLTATLDPGGGAVVSAAVRGFMGSLAFEQPELRPTALTIDGLDAAATILRELLAHESEPAVAARGGGRFVHRLRAAVLPEETAAFGAAWREGSVLITGGPGALGRAIAGRLLQAGATSLILASRRGEAALDATGAAELAALGRGDRRVQVVRADVTRRSEMERLFDEAERSGRPVSAVLHLAGRLEDGLARGLDQARVHAVLEPKLGGALVLDAITRERPVSAFVLFSSLAGVVGSPGQAAYAAANASLDALSRARRAAGFPALSIAWPAWRETGLAAGAGRRASLSSAGALDPAAALDVFERVLGIPEPSVAILPAAPFRLEAFGLATPPILFEIEPPAATVDARVARERLLSLAPEERRRELEDHVHTCVADALGLKAASFTRRDSLTSLGLDSLMALAIRNRLVADLGDAPALPVLLSGASVSDLAASLHAALDAPVPASTFELEEGAL